MSIAPVLAVLNASLAITSALLSAAAFTPAIALFLVLAPLSTALARRQQRVSAWIVAGAAVAAWCVSPLDLRRDELTAPLIWLVWVGLWSALGIWAPRASPPQ